MSQEVKKGPLAALTFEASKNFILTYFQKLMWFIYLLKKIVYWAKFEGNFFQMRNTLDRSYRDRLLNLMFSWFKTGRQGFSQEAALD